MFEATHLQHLLRHLIDIIGIGAEGINEIGEESKKQRQGAAVNDRANCADSHQNVIEPVCEPEELAERDGGRRRTSILRLAASVGLH